MMGERSNQRHSSGGQYEESPQTSPITIPGGVYDQNAELSPSMPNSAYHHTDINPSGQDPTYQPIRVRDQVDEVCRKDLPLRDN